jgi:NAD(P)-dependent dehydrogenase (short-subunit alcohol dehydrogenase family)
VFAGVRRDADGQALVSKASGTVLPVLLDVTRQVDIDAAAAYIGGMVGDTGLHGLFNNAGIGVGGPLEFLPAGMVQQQFQVNVFGAIAVTQAFLPLVRRARGRILFTSSNSGFWCEPFLSVYGGTKHALEAIGDSLRVELRPWGIHVALIEPGMIKTPIWDKARQSAANASGLLPEEAYKLYAAPLDSLRRMVQEPPAIAASPRRVALSVQHALESRRPKTRYRVGIDSRLQFYLRHLMTDRMRDRIAMMIMGL